MLEILQNIVTGACYRPDGEPFGRHEPALGIGTRGTLRWRLFTATPENAAVSGWTPCTAFASGTFGARCSGDADFIGTRMTKLKTALAAGAATAIDVLTDLEAADVPASGELGFTDDAGSAVRLAYSARLLTADGMRFTVDAELDTAVSAGTAVEVPDAPFFTAAHDTGTSAPATGVFDFDLAIDSAKLRRAAAAASGERLNLTLELLVYEISGGDVTERRRCFCRSAAVDLGILGRLPGTPPTPDDANALLAYLRLIAPDYLPHIGANGHWFIGSTDTGIDTVGAATSAVSAHNSASNAHAGMFDPADAAYWAVIDHNADEEAHFGHLLPAVGENGSLLVVSGGTAAWRYGDAMQAVTGDFTAAPGVLYTITLTQNKTIYIEASGNADFDFGLLVTQGATPYNLTLLPENMAAPILFPDDNVPPVFKSANTPPSIGTANTSYLYRFHYLAALNVLLANLALTVEVTQ